MDRRYLKRMNAYWMRAHARSLRSFDRLDLSSWFDLWHTHPDWNARGNRCAEDRAAVARNTYRLLQHAEQLVQARGDEIQVFATVCEDTGNNAVYLHTANPNGTPFPHAFSHVDWRATTPTELAGIVDQAKHEVGCLRLEEAHEYIIRKRHS